MSYWNDHPGAIEALSALWTRGLTASAIATEMTTQFGSKISRNAVLGKVHRIGLDGRASPIKSGGNSRDRNRNARQKARNQALGIVEKPRVPDDMRPMPALSRHAGDACQWIEGAARGRDFCLRRTIAGHSWCPDHFKRVFLPPKRKQSA